MPTPTLISRTFIVSPRNVRIAHTLGLCVAGIAAGIRLFRAAPPLGDVGTRGAELSRWITERNSE